MSNAHHIPTTPACLPRPRPESPHNADLISTLPDSILLPSCKGQDARHAVRALPSLFCPHPHVSLHAKHLPSRHIPSPASPAPVPHLNKLPSTLGNPPSSRKPSWSTEGASYLQFVLLHGILQSCQEVSILLLQPGHLALQAQQLLGPLISLCGKEKSFGLRWGLIRHWDTPALSLPCPQLTQSYSPLCSKICLATGASGPI